MTKRNHPSPSRTKMANGSQTDQLVRLQEQFEQASRPVPPLRHVWVSADRPASTQFWDFIVPLIGPDSQHRTQWPLGDGGVDYCCFLGTEEAFRGYVSR